MKLTASPDEALALKAKGRSPRCLSAGLAKVMVWSLFCVLVTAKDCMMGVAGLIRALPSCVAVIEQVPVATSVTVLPLTVQTPSVLLVKLTGSPDEALALRA